MGINYDRALAWLNKHHENAEKRDDHYERRVVEYIKEVLWRDNDMRNS